MNLLRTSLLAVVLCFAMASCSKDDTSESLETNYTIDLSLANKTDWRMANASDSKIKKTKGGLPVLEFAENPDILAEVSQMDAGRPGLVVGFAAETDDVVAHATAKRLRKGCDWIVANDVSPATGVMGGDRNTVTVIDGAGEDHWPEAGKAEVATRLAARIADHLARDTAEC